MDVFGQKDLFVLLVRTRTYGNQARNIF